MRREDLGGLAMLLVVAEEKSFTRAAARLGLSQSSLSHAIRRLEDRLGLRLLARTTRSVSLTEAGVRLMGSVGPAFAEIDQGLEALSALKSKPAGTVRINSSWHAAETILWPAVSKLLPDYPELRVEIVTDQAMTDIVAERFDAGVRLGEQVAKDMIAVRIGPDLRMAVVGSPSYFAIHPEPQSPRDLTHHQCIGLRLASSGGELVWEFEREGQVLHVRVEAQLIFSKGKMALDAALDGYGLGYVLEDQATPHIKAGRLKRALELWCPSFSGYHLYYPSRRQPSSGFAAVVDCLSWRSGRAP